MLQVGPDENGLPVANGHRTSLRATVPIRWFVGFFENEPEIRRGGPERVPIPVPKSKSRITPEAASFGTRIGLGGSRRSPEHPLILTRNRA